MIEMKELKLFLITDPHYFAPELGAYGEHYDDFMDFEQKCFAETSAINKAAIEYLKESKEADIVLIAGDLSFNGEKESHRQYSAILRDLQNSGKRIFVVTAGHDISRSPFAYDGGERISVEGITFHELLDYYGDFGYSQAIAFNKEHLSYVADLSDDVRLLVLCNDTAEGNNIPYDDDFFNWIEEMAQQAQKDGKVMIAMEHYPVLPGQPILTLIPDARQKDSQRLINTLADNGVHLIFTGHMHNQSINCVTTEKGNKFYDVCTGSLIGCPAFMRLVTIEDEKTVHIKSIPVPDFEWDTKDKSCTQYLQDQFDRMILSVITGMRDNPSRSLGKLGIHNKKLEKPVRVLGNVLCTWPTGKITCLLFVKAHPHIKDERFLDVLLSIARYAFYGDQPYTEGTPVGDTFLKILKRLNPIFKILNKKIKGSQGEKIDMYELLKHSAGNYGISDFDATLELK